MGLPAAAIVWAAMVAQAAILGNWMGYGGRRFAIALGVAAVLFAFEWFLAAPPVLQSIENTLGGKAALFASLVPLAAVIVYSFGVSGSTRLALAGSAYAIAPALLLASTTGKAPGIWEDYAAAVALWLPMQF